jgi:hypothetical protein
MTGPRRVSAALCGHRCGLLNTRQGFQMQLFGV